MHSSGVLVFDRKLQSAGKCQIWGGGGGGGGGKDPRATRCRELHSIRAGTSLLACRRNVFELR